LANDHPNATNVVLVPRQADPSGPSDPTDPADPSDPTDPTDPSDPTDPMDPTSPPSGEAQQPAGGTAPTPVAARAPGADAAAEDGELARTGSDVRRLVPMALALLVGGILVITQRRPHRARRSA
jgi:hypothetical protein